MKNTVKQTANALEKTCQTYSFEVRLLQGIPPWKFPYGSLSSRMDFEVMFGRFWGKWCDPATTHFPYIF